MLNYNSNLMKGNSQNSHAKFNNVSKTDVLNLRTHGSVTPGKKNKKLK